MVHEPAEASDRSNRADPVTRAQLDALTPEIELHLRNWQSTLRELDARYADKGLLALAARAMVDQEFRARLLTDSANALTEFKVTVPLPEYSTLNFVENTTQTLTVILPSTIDQLKESPESLAPFLESRLTTKTPIPGDDLNFTSYGNEGDQGRDGFVLGDGNVVWGGDPSGQD